MIKVILLALGLLPLAVGANEWKVDGKDGSQFVRLYTNGQIVDGHVFGFVKPVANCSLDLFWISFYSHNIDESAKGEDVVFSLSVDDLSPILQAIPVVSVVKRTPDVKAVGFTGAYPRKNLVPLLSKSNSLELSIIAPDNTLAKFDVATDMFSLNGFNDAYIKAVTRCKQLASIENDKY